MFAILFLGSFVMLACVFPILKERLIKVEREVKIVYLNNF